MNSPLADRTGGIMRAVLTRWYGSGSMLRLGSTETPRVRANDVLVRVHAAGVNPVDWKIRKGLLFMVTGIRPPRVLGSDYAGVVEKVGSDVSDYAPGDAVWGKLPSVRGGAYAEYLRANPKEIGPKPQNLDFEEAASLPTVALTAYQALVHRGKLAAGEHVLVNGGSGGVGTAALQIAKALGAQVTGVCSTPNLRLARDLGADDVIDYTQNDPLAQRSRYDVIFDTVGKLSLYRAGRALTRGGRYLSTLPSLGIVLFGPAWAVAGGKRCNTVMVQPNALDLAALGVLVEEGQLVPVIEQTYSLAQVRDAHARSETGRVVGKLVLTVPDATRVPT